MTLTAFVSDLDGRHVLRGQRSGGDAAELGRALAAELLEQGAAALLGR